MAVLPTPASPTYSGLFFRRRQSTCTVRSSSDLRPISGSMWPLAASALSSVQYASSGFFAGRRAFVVVAAHAADAFTLVAARAAALAVALLLDAVADVVEEVVAGDAFFLEEEERLAVGLAEQRDQHVGRVHHLLLGGQRVEGGALQHPLHPDGLLRLGLASRRAAAPPSRRGRCRGAP